MGALPGIRRARVARRTRRLTPPCPWVFRLQLSRRMNVVVVPRLELAIRLYKLYWRFMQQCNFRQHRSHRTLQWHNTLRCNRWWERADILFTALTIPRVQSAPFPELQLDLGLSDQPAVKSYHERRQRMSKPHDGDLLARGSLTPEGFAWRAPQVPTIHKLLPASTRSVFTRALRIQSFSLSCVRSDG